MAVSKPSTHSASGSYALPHDAPEHTRLDWQSRALTEMMDGREFLTDIPALARDSPSPFLAIEVGPGTGLRTAALGNALQAEGQSEAKVYGIDISPMPNLHPQPANVEFVQADIMDVLSRRDARLQPETFNFLTHRMLIAGLNLHEYTQTCFDLLAAGGRVEFQDTSLRWFDAADREISHQYAWLRVFTRASAVLGLDPVGPERLPAWLREVGFVDVEVESFRWLTSAEDAADIAQYTSQVLNESVFPDMARRIVQRAGLDESEMEALGSLEGFLEDYRRTLTGDWAKKGTYTKFWVVRARKA